MLNRVFSLIRILKISTLKILIIFWFCIFFNNYSKGQDPQFSHFFNNEFYYNPAATGLNKDFNLSVTDRALWMNPNSIGYNIKKVSFDFGLREFWGGGLIINSFREGDGRLTTTDLGLAFGKRKKLNKYNYLGIGFLGSLINKEIINENELVFSDQIHALNGYIPNSTSNYYSYNYNESSGFKPDVAWGAYYEYLGTQVNSWVLRCGYAEHHILKPNMSFSSASYKLPFRRLFYVNANVPLYVKTSKTKVWLSPAIMLDNQGGKTSHFKEITTILAGSNINHYNGFTFGLWYRQWIYNKGTGIVNLGYTFDFKNDIYFSVAYTHDMHFSELSNANFHSGELNLSIYRSIKYKRGTFQCPKDLYFISQREVKMRPD